MAGITAETTGHGVVRDGGVATVTFERAAAYNALDAATLESLLRTLASLSRDADVRALVLTGAGKAFCAGQALDDERTLPAGGAPDLLGAVERRYNPLILALLSLEKPVVAAVNGVAAGAGFGIACACDFRVVASSASFSTAFVKIGLVPDSGTSFLLPRIVGYAKAVELCLLSAKIDAARADALGLCTSVVEPERCVPAAQELAAELARGPRAIGLIKRELLRNGLGDVRAALAYEAEMQSIAGQTADFAEGLAAFRAKRAPNFSGT